MQFGSASAGSATHLGCALLNAAIGVNVTHIPYRGGAPAMQDLVAGRIDYLCIDTPIAIPLIEGGQIKALAILTRGRSASLPNLPTAQEQGLADFEAANWAAFFMPKGTPDADREQARGGQRCGDRLAGRAEAYEGNRRRSGRARPPLAGVSGDVRRGRNRQMGRPGQGERIWRRNSGYFAGSAAAFSTGAQRAISAFT